MTARVCYKTAVAFPSAKVKTRLRKGYGLLNLWVFKLFILKT